MGLRVKRFGRMEQGEHAGCIEQHCHSHEDLHIPVLSRIDALVIDPCRIAEIGRPDAVFELFSRASFSALVRESSFRPNCVPAIPRRLGPDQNPLCRLLLQSIVGRVAHL